MAKSSKQVVLYRIKNTTTGLYSTGSSAPSFDVLGKFWKLGALKNHLNLIKKIIPQVYAGCIIVQSTITDEPNTTFSLEEYFFEKFL